MAKNIIPGLMEKARQDHDASTKIIEALVLLNEAEQLLAPDSMEQEAVQATMGELAVMAKLLRAGYSFWATPTITDNQRSVIRQSLEWAAEVDDPQDDAFPC